VSSFVLDSVYQQIEIAAGEIRAAYAEPEQAVADDDFLLAFDDEANPSRRMTGDVQHFHFDLADFDNVAFFEQARAFGLSSTGIAQPPANRTGVVEQGDFRSVNRDRRAGGFDDAAVPPIVVGWRVSVDDETT